MSEERPQQNREEQAREEARETPEWKTLYANHLSHLSRTYKERTPDGEKVTEEWLHEEATNMADALYRMKMRREALEAKHKKETEYPTTLGPEARAKLVEQVHGDDPVAAEAARRVLEMFDKQKK